MLMANSKYKRLAAFLRDDILTGKLTDKLPTEMELMQRHEVSRQTVRHALDLLTDEGLITSRQGSGTYVSLNRETRPDPKKIVFVSSSLSDYIFPSIVRGIEHELQKTDYSLSLLSTDYRFEREAEILQSLISDPPSGILIEGNRTVLPSPNMRLYRQLIQMRVPMIFLHSGQWELTEIPSVTTDDRAGGKDAVHYLADRGHRSLAGVFNCQDGQSINRYYGMLRAMQERGLQFHDDAILWYQSNDTLDILLQSDSTMQFFSESSAIVCYNDQAAIRILRYLTERGVRVPDEKSLISFDDSVFSQFTTPGITSFIHPKEAMGRMAASRLLGLITGHPEACVPMPWGLAERGSVADLSGI